MERAKRSVVVLLALATLVAVGMGSCTKNKTKMLIKKWTIEKVAISELGIEVDLTPSFRGATFDFRKDGTYSLSEGKGEGAGKLAKLLRSEGTWEMDEKNGTWVKLNGQKYTIEEHHDGKLHLRGPVYLVLK